MENFVLIEWVNLEQIYMIKLKKKKGIIDIILDNSYIENQWNEKND